jgi:site-specific recombinase XerD
VETKKNEAWLEQFKAYLQRRFPDRSTAKHYLSDMRSFLAEYSGSLLEVKRADIDNYIDEQRRQGMAAATVKRRAAALKTFFDFVAEEVGEVGRENPVWLKRHGGRIAHRLPRSLRDEEVTQFWAVIEDSRDQALVTLMLYGGLRVEEVVNVTLAAISEPAEVQEPVCIRVIGKGRKERIVYLAHSFYQPVAAYLTSQAVWQPRQPLFTNRRGEPLSIAGVQWVIRQYAQASGVAVTCHRLRHTCARWLAEGEMPLLSLARFLGHSSLQATQRYIDGANPHLRRHYEQAMQPLAKPAGPAAWPALEAQPPLALTPAPAATVRRTPPDRFEPPQWMEAWPAWWRDSCLLWLEHKWFTWKPSRRQSNAMTQLRDLRSFWGWQLAQREWVGWDDLQLADVAAFVQAALQRGLAAKTVKTSLDRVYELLDFLLARGQRATRLSRPDIALPESLPRHLPPEELLTLETYVKHQTLLPNPDWLLLALYYVLAHGGLRLCEVLDLKVADLDLAAHRLWVREGKGRRDRLVYLTPTACQALHHYLPTVPHAPADLLFSRHSLPLTSGQVNYSLGQLAK